MRMQPAKILYAPQKIQFNQMLLEVVIILVSIYNRERWPTEHILIYATVLHRLAIYHTSKNIKGSALQGEMHKTLSTGENVEIGALKHCWDQHQHFQLCDDHSMKENTTLTS